MKNRRWGGGGERGKGIQLHRVTASLLVYNNNNNQMKFFLDNYLISFRTGLKSGSEPQIMYWLPVIHTAATNANSTTGTFSGISGAIGPEVQASDSPFSSSLSKQYNLSKSPESTKTSPSRKSTTCNFQMEMLSPSLRRERDSPVFTFPDVHGRRSQDCETSSTVVETFSHLEMFSPENDPSRDKGSATFEYKGRITNSSKTKPNSESNTPTLERY
ncbi:hypothetical protein Btru_023465 [Bulinus truncatus]|nr:hypothetical protein Btru_023465 [Bulinus truncatus]